MATRAKKTAAPEATAEVVYEYGIRTWEAGGKSHGDFAWDLRPGARNEAPDWKPTKECGYGLHANRFGMEDWSLLGDISGVKRGGRVLGVVRWDSALAIDLDGKHKAPWMEVVLTTETADLASVLAAISRHRNDHLFTLAERLAKQKKTLATTGEGSAAATTGNRSAAATTGYGSAAATTGGGSAAATTGNRSAAATTGEGSAAATTGNRSAAATTGNRSAA
ncbi:MAG TPA: hypothetical protein VG248_03625, partial [Caulobacteraceae bacterium]|nr:hypothetical protein [Caulobacteraceae bacterium]